MKFEWEEIASSTSLHSGFRTCRGRVIGGWLVKNLVWHDDASTQSESMVFIADPNHQWELNLIPENEILSKSIYELDLDTRCINALRAEKIHTIRELINKTKINILRMPNLSHRSCKLIEDSLAKHGLKLKE